MIQRNFNQIWEQLRAKKIQYREFLEEITIKNIRGIKDLSVRFDFPVSVIAGPNASGKSTVLFACACGYRVPGSNPKIFTPSTLFPNLKIKDTPNLSDLEQTTSFEFYYIHQGKRSSMKWAKGKSWNRSFMGQKEGKQPERLLYIRTLANLTSPSEVRSVLQIASGSFEMENITSDLIAFAQRILPLKYKDMTMVKKGGKELLFATRDNTEESKYSEFHMSAGERAILRISKDISNLRNGLVLIDEIEAGMHPFTQQQIMLELQRLALRNDLQIIVTSHSPVILDSVPIEGRIFLERIDNNVIVKPAYKDIIQKAFYGQSLEKLSILCEDDIAEAFLYGVLDYLNPNLGLIHDDVVIGRDTGKEQFTQHIQAIAKFNLLDNFIFALDGDARSIENSLKKTAEDFGKSITPLFLPGKDVPERWAWQILGTSLEEYSKLLGVPESDMKTRMSQNEQIYASAADKPTEIMKNKFASFCEQIKRAPTDVIRLAARNESARQQGEMKIFLDDLETQIRRWQSRK